MYTSIYIYTYIYIYAYARQAAYSFICRWKGRPYADIGIGSQQHRALRFLRLCGFREAPLCSIFTEYIGCCYIIVTLTPVQFWWLASNDLCVCVHTDLEIRDLCTYRHTHICACIHVIAYINDTYICSYTYKLYTHIRICMYIYIHIYIYI